MEVDAKGRALARVTAVIQPSGNSSVVHFWNTTVVVGNGEYASGIGDDLCPTYQPVTKANLGLGVLGPGSSRVKVPAYQGSSTCTNGALIAKAGSRLEVWVEDDREECRGKRIALTSYYKSVGYEQTYSWQTSMTPLVETTLDVERESSLRVLTVVEGSPDVNPNKTCGNEAATIVSQAVLDGGILTTSKGILPASGGQGHLVLSTDTTQTVSPGSHKAILYVGKNFTSSAVKTGGCCGDGVVAILDVSP